MQISRAAKIILFFVFLILGCSLVCCLCTLSRIGPFIELYRVCDSAIPLELKNEICQYRGQATIEKVAIEDIDLYKFDIVIGPGLFIGGWCTGPDLYIVRQGELLYKEYFPCSDVFFNNVSYGSNDNYLIFTLNNPKYFAGYLWLYFIDKSSNKLTTKELSFEGNKQILLDKFGIDVENRKIYFMYNSQIVDVKDFEL